MIIFFDDEALEELYSTGRTSDKKYKRLQSGVIKAYIKAVNYLRVATRIEDLFRIHSLRYEKKAGDLRGEEYVRINDKYRLRLSSFAGPDGVVVNVKLIEISKHYE
ncbi:MAG: type II toxin-antitoxin system RelE/ParE family toxin [Ruminococcus sp.]|nr:type II toxin-antitoxin system RelE/ParE family toxin [Ruminococcus sp.]